jgi:plasmid maintenance system antidote protein VapI
MVRPATAEALRGVLAVIGMSQAELARRSGLSTKHINQLLQGNVHLTTGVAVIIADAIAEHLLSLELNSQLQAARAERTAHADAGKRSRAT